jgi:hypothetical protein
MLPQAFYPEGSYGALGRHIKIFDAYAEQHALWKEGGLDRMVEAGEMTAQEAQSTSDFPSYLAFFIRRVFQEPYTEIQGQWDQWTQPISVEDFLQYSFTRWGRFPNIPRKPLNGPYARIVFTELPGGNYQIVEWGAEWDVTRQLIISDRLNKLAEAPRMLGEAMARTQSTEAVTVLESNPTMWDGNALFSSNHHNIGSTALTPDINGANAVIAGIDAIDTQTDDQGYKVNNPTSPLILLIPRALRWIADTLLNQDQLPLDSTSATSLLRPNALRRTNVRITVVEDWFLTDTNNWYLLAAPTSRIGTIAALNLQGNTIPFIGLRRPETAALFGGDDPYTFAFEEQQMKVRHDFEYVAYEWKTAYGAIVS